MKSLSDTQFALALQNLARQLQFREDHGFARIIEPDGPTILRQIAHGLREDNFKESNETCTEALRSIGMASESALDDGPDSIEAAWRALMEVDLAITKKHAHLVGTELGLIIDEKIKLLDRKQMLSVGP